MNSGRDVSAVMIYETGAEIALNMQMRRLWSVFFNIYEITRGNLLSIECVSMIGVGIYVIEKFLSYSKVPSKPIKSILSNFQ